MEGSKTNIQPAPLNVTVKTNNYGCFGIGGFGKLEMKIDSSLRNDKKIINEEEHNKLK